MKPTETTKAADPATPMTLTPVMQRYVLHWGEMGTKWGVNRSVAQIHALLYLAGRPMTAEEIADVLGIARSNVSNSIKELQGWKLVQLTHVMGDRRDHFEALGDNWQILTTIVAERKKREIDPTIEVLRALKQEAAEDNDTPKAVKDKISELLTFMEVLSSWYEGIRALPKNTLIKLMRLGAKVANFIK